ncbi:MAG: SGNH/GDSL hydrolase family protein [Agathobacter sp.]|nr:SGNH/GDSL hydrolase family protein [Agathobacter sp.]
MRRKLCIFGLAASLLIAACGCGKTNPNDTQKGANSQMNETETDSTGNAPDLSDSSGHFVPENPDQMPTMDGDDDNTDTPDQTAEVPLWYSVMLNKSHTNLGNNKRLKAVIEKARAGEQITIATIGGSITEGAGAKKYQECYAYQFYDKFRQEYGKDDGSNVSFVNAGVGGTGSPFGYLRYERDIVSRVEDADGLPDIVVIEFSVNDYQEPTKQHCYESMVKHILSQPNDPVVILLFAVFPGGFNLQDEIKPIGFRYKLMMVSIKDGPFTYVGDKATSQWTESEFFYDQYHPTTLGHGVMADCLIDTVKAAEQQATSKEDIDLTVKPVYGDDYLGLKTIYKTDYEEDIHMDFGSFTLDDTQSYSNGPVGRVCGENFHHGTDSGNAPLTFETSCKNLLVSYRATGDAGFGDAEVYVDGKLAKTLQGNTGSWGQSVQDVIFADETAAVHKVEIKMAAGSENKKFTITCIGYTP